VSRLDRAMASELVRTGEPDDGGSPRKMSLPRAVSFWGFASLVILAVVFYLWWGLSFGVWIDNGVYAVTITLLLFGLAGMWLVLPSAPAPAAPPP
jgi:type VI protein secretion system component VasF